MGYAISFVLGCAFGTISGSYRGVPDLVVHVMLRIPWMILGETSLSFPGLGIRSPVVSWGTLLNEGENIRIPGARPLAADPGLFVVVAVLAFSLVSDGLRDAADPYR